MRVLCINENWRDDGVYEPDSPICGSVYTVIDVEYHKEEVREVTATHEMVALEGIWYQLLEFKKDIFHSCNFSTIPPVEESELIEQLQTADIDTGG